MLSLPSAKVDNRHFAFPHSITHRQYRCHRQRRSLGVKTMMSCFTTKKTKTTTTMRVLPISQLRSNHGKMFSTSKGGLGLSFASPLTFCLPLDQATSSFQQRIKQLLTEERCDWQVEVSFLVRGASLSVFPEVTFHIPAWLEPLLKFSAVKYEGNSLFTPFV